VELEVAGGAAEELARSVNYLCPATVITDGSVRGERPREILIGPCPTNLWNQVMDVWRKESFFYPLNINMSCGFHVHVDAREMSGYGLEKLLRLWRVVEPWFYNLCDPRRKYCRYAVPWPEHFTETIDAILALRDAGGTISELKKALLGKLYDCRMSGDKDVYAGLSRAIASKKVEARYYGLNLPSWYYQGTFEFRFHEGCVDGEEVRRWTLLCSWLVELADKLTLAEVKAITLPPHLFLGQWSRNWGMLRMPDVVGLYAMEQRPHGPPVPQIPLNLHTSLDYQLCNGQPYTAGAVPLSNLPIPVDWVKGIDPAALAPTPPTRNLLPDNPAPIPLRVASYTAQGDINTLNQAALLYAQWHTLTPNER
jgi:hypothetical protein